MYIYIYIYIYILIVYLRSEFEYILPYYILFISQKKKSLMIDWE